MQTTSACYTKRSAATLWGLSSLLECGNTGTRVPRFPSHNPNITITQPSIPPTLVDRVPACLPGVKAGRVHLRWEALISYGRWRSLALISETLYTPLTSLNHVTWMHRRGHRVKLLETSRSNIKLSNVWTIFSPVNQLLGRCSPGSIALARCMTLYGHGHNAHYSADVKPLRDNNGDNEISYI